LLHTFPGGVYYSTYTLQQLAIDQGESVFVQVVSAVVIFSYILFSMSFGGTL